jgi:hypothetical protein
MRSPYGRQGSSAWKLIGFPHYSLHYLCQSKLQHNGHTFSGSYEGVIATKSIQSGEKETLACGQCGPLLRDGHEVLALKKPADLVLKRNGNGGYRAMLEGVPDQNTVQMTH